MSIIHKMYITTILLCFTLFVPAISCRSCNIKPRKIVIDTDAGGDDALAIMLALMYETKTCNIEILAITCTYGNTRLENVEQNVLKILTVANRSDIPVYSGADKPYIDEYKPDNFFGEDGFGDFNFTQNITAKVDRSINASELLVNLVKQYPDEITLITLGPLTNTAEAIRLEPNFLHLVKQHVAMGSNIKPRTRIDGTKFIEFNFRQDPESNWIALNFTNKPTVIFPIDAVYKNSIPKKEYKRIFNLLDTRIATFLQLAEKLAVNKTKAWEPADGMAMAIALYPEIITESFEANLTPVIVGDARGSVVIDFRKQHNAKVIENFALDVFKNILLMYLS